MDESGRVSVDDVFAVGLLIVRNPDWLKGIVQKARDAGYKGEFHLTKIHKQSFPAYERLIDGIFSHFDRPRARQHIRFRTVCVLGKTQMRRTQKEHIAYNYYVEWTLRHNLGSEMRDSVLYLDKKSRYDEDNLLVRLQTMADIHRPGVIKKIEELDSSKSDFLQVCDVLTGLVRFGNLINHRLIHNHHLESTRGRLKLALWEMVERHYGKRKPVSCHQIKSGSFSTLQNQYAPF